MRRKSAKCSQDVKITDTGHGKKYVFDALGLVAA